MNILYISNNSCVDGGANKSLIDICTGQMWIGNHVAIVSPQGIEFEKKLKEESITHYVVKNMSTGVTGTINEGIRNNVWNYVKKIFLPILVYFRVKKLCQIAKDFNADIIHTNTSCSYEGALVSNKMNIPHVWHIREMMEEDYQIKYIKSKKYMKGLFHQSNYIICISEATKDKFSPLIDPRRSLVLYNAVTMAKITQFNPVLKNKIEGDFIFIMVGGVMHAKGTHDAIKAFGRAFHGKEHVKLWIVGNYGENGDYYQNLLKSIRDLQICSQVKFWGKQDNVTNLVSASDVGLMCSYAEGLGRVTIEYMMCGKPVIGAAAGGTLELVKDGENGYLYEAGDTNELADKMILVYNNQVKATKMGGNGAIMANSKFEKNTYAERLHKIYIGLDNVETL